MTCSRETSRFESLEARRLLHAGHDHGTLEEVHRVAVDDAHVRGGQFASTNFSDAIEMEVKTSSQSLYDRDAYLRFDISAIDPALTESVTLRLFAGSSQPTSTTAVPLAVRLAAATWSETSINYLSAPALTGTPVGAMSVVGAKKWFEIDITQAVLSARHSDAAFIAFGVEGTKNVSPYALINSSEAATNQPELVALIGTGEGGPVDPPPVAPDETLQAIDDAHVRGGADANLNFGSSGQLQIKFSTSTTYQRFAYVRFDITSLIGRSVPSAKLRLWGETSQENGTIIPVVVSGANDNWAESTVTFNTRPALVGGALGTINLTSAPKWFEVNVTSFIQAAANAGKTSVTLALAGVNSSSPFGVINSTESSINRPALVIGAGAANPAQPIAWEASATGPIKREEAVTFDLGGKMFVLGGYVDSVAYVATQRMDVFDPLTNVWSRLNDAPSKLTHVGTAVDTQTSTVWMVGGLIGDLPSPMGTNVVWKYSPTTDTWERGPDLPEGRFAGGAAIVGRKLYYFGGSDEARLNDKLDTWSLDLDAPDAAWQPVASMPAARNHFGHAAVGTRIYVIGGQTGLQSESITQNSVLMYDTLTDSWSQVAPLPRVHGHFHASTDVYKDRYILIGGGDEAHNVPVDDVYLYDTQTNTWTGLTDLPDARRAPVGRIIGDIYYIGTGFNRSSGFTDLMWKADLSVLGLA